MTNSASALVIDDHPLVARGIADFLVSYCGFYQAIPICSVSKLWEAFESIPLPTLAVVDFWLPDGASLNLLAQLKQQYPALRILAISADDNTAIMDKVRAAGADGFLHKQAAPDEFAKVVMALMAGELWFPEPPRNSVSAAHDLPVTAAELGLTARQGEVLVMMLKGLPNKRIALNLSLSEQTVKEHVSGILERLGARNRFEVITLLRGKTLGDP